MDHPCCITDQGSDHISVGKGKLEVGNRSQGWGRMVGCFFKWSCWLILMANEYNLSFLLLSAVEGFVSLINLN